MGPQLLKFFSSPIPLPGSIKRRVLLSGVVIMCISAVGPLYVRSKVTNLQQQYQETVALRMSLTKIHDLAKLLTATETQLRVYISTRQNLWLKSISKNQDTSHSLIGELSEELAATPSYATKIENVDTEFHRWEDEVLNKHLTGNSSPKPLLSQIPLHEPISLQMHSLLNELENDLTNTITVRDSANIRATRRMVRAAGYYSILLFLVTLGGLMSLWWTLVPALNALMKSVNAIKSGNLNHRIPHALLNSVEEMKTLGTAFNEMAASLKEQNETLVKLNHIKTDFVSTVSHELRTPLTAIKGSLGLILGGVTGNIPPEARGLLEITAKNTDRLIRLISDILDISKIEAGKLRLQLDKYNVCNLISHAIVGLEGYAANHEIRITWQPLEPAPLVVLDGDRFEQVLTNLLSNAVKFSKPNSEVAVTVSTAPDHVIIKVSDQGCGIAPEKQSLLFQKFQQLDSVTHKNKEGTGLGLAIAKALVEEHSGKIWVESTPDKGSDFFFSLPWNGDVDTSNTSSTSNNNSPAQAA